MFHRAATLFSSPPETRSDLKFCEKGKVFKSSNTKVCCYISEPLNFQGDDTVILQDHVTDTTLVSVLHTSQFAAMPVERFSGSSKHGGAGTNDARPHQPSGASRRRPGHTEAVGRSTTRRAEGHCRELNHPNRSRNAATVDSSARGWRHHSANHHLVSGCRREPIHAHQFAAAIGRRRQRCRHSTNQQVLSSWRNW
ncbi:hypothetical protein LSTR_LSTR003202 [Laodelphax striatellus]|uniref:Uncharacterized protein n=1 Tax=Laodelphax striatellus TaxID=195883 RepID=A0A482XS61_LAOST|nr:hypothetical protein LSTR_LSTR003202 [Laodelphax striatellus]